MLDQAVARLCGVREAMQCAAGHSSGLVQAETMQGWMESIGSAIGDLIEVERIGRYREAFAAGAALVDVTIEGPPGRITAVK